LKLESSQTLMSVRKLQIFLTAPARADLRSIAQYGQLNWGEERTTQYLAEIDGLFRSLVHFPDLGRKLQIVNGRAIAVGTHIVYYRREANEIRVLRILHKRMLPEGQFQ
jgi:toxin ParE1/3/4